MLSDTEVGLKYPGIFRGEVISHLPVGRCKVWIPDVYSEEWRNSKSSELKDVYGNDLIGSMLPDAEQASPLFGGAKSGNGSFSYPKLGSYVWCMFERGDIQHPIYFAASIDITDMSTSGSNSFIETTIKTDSGNSLKHKIICGKSIITFEENGTITLENGPDASIKLERIPVQKNENSGSDTLNESYGRITINASDVMITGHNVKVKSSLMTSLESWAITKLWAGLRLSGESTFFNLNTSGSCLINGKEFVNKKIVGMLPFVSKMFPMMGNDKEQ